MMTVDKDQLADIMRRIETADARARYRFQPQLRAVLKKMEEGGQVVPRRAHDLHQDLLCEAIEAQFDNLPV